jgi:class 3 adenylate cyclase/GTPase SAR1 family protein
LEEPASDNWAAGLAFNPVAPVLATLGEHDTVIRLWHMDEEQLLTALSISRPTRYCNAKVVLVGDTGVGKSALGLVLSGMPFTPTESTHGRRVWELDRREINVGSGRSETQETLLWDLAGQPGYRLIHQLHLGEVAVALVVFDARNELDSLSGVRHWVRALRQAARLQEDSALPLKTFLVAARIDRGGAGLSADRVAALVQDLGLAGYFETSAKEGFQIPELRNAVLKAIDWAALPKVSSTELFQSIKSLLLAEKKAGRFLVTTRDLYRTFLGTPEAPAGTEDLEQQFKTCVGRVESQGLIRRLSFGDLVLLQPELLDAYASALVNAAKDEPDGLGCIAEKDAREGRFRIPADERIPDRGHEKLLLIAMVEDLLRHELALSEPADDGAHLVFPSQLTREFPTLTDPEGKAVVFTFDGPVLNIYATLAVRLAHSGLFRKKEMWKNAATYLALAGGTCGVFLREFEEGRSELTLMFDQMASEQQRFQFEEYVHAHLQRRALPETIHRRRILVCKTCGTPLTDLQVTRRRERGFDWIHCGVCEERVPFEDGVTSPGGSSASVISTIDRTAHARREFDARLVSASGEMGSQGFTEWAGGARTTLALTFTDIVGSTALTSEVGNATMNDWRRAHFRRARQLLRERGGYEVKTLGDSLMVAFRMAVDAVRFALALVDGSGHERIRVRAGIHVGQVHIEEEDAYGQMVNYTARVVAQAEGQGVWVSDRAMADLKEERPKDLESVLWREHPVCQLKGFAGTHRLWSVVGQALTAQDIGSQSG